MEPCVERRKLLQGLIAGVGGPSIRSRPDVPCAGCAGVGLQAGAAHGRRVASVMKRLERHAQSRGDRGWKRCLGEHGWSDADGNVLACELAIRAARGIFTVRVGEEIIVKIKRSPE